MIREFDEEQYKTQALEALHKAKKVYRKTMMLMYEYMDFDSIDESNGLLLLECLDLMDRTWKLCEDQIEQQADVTARLKRIESKIDSLPKK